MPIWNRIKNGPSLSWQSHDKRITISRSSISDYDLDINVLGKEQADQFYFLIP